MFFVSLGLMITAVVFLATWGLRFGVDFRGGSELELTFSQRPAVTDLTTVLTKLSLPELKDVTVSPTGNTGVVIRSDTLTEDQHQTVLQAIKKAFPGVQTTEARFDSIGPVIGSELKSKAVSAIVAVIIAIALYIAIVFRGMRRTLSWWVMSFATMVALAHDVLLPLGVFALLGHIGGVEISAVFVAAILTIMGYSISDTVVVFDRVRENIVKGRLGRDVSFAEAVHRSIMQTVVRSINTNISVLLSLIAIFLFGGASIKYFALALIVGIFSGAYSSIFVASPLLVWMGRRRG
ncbi:MAG TPA: protein translocase subunit SecF [Candidatus Paceibacterota bacterium]|nr:protein translocase subunit SecF [Candidatus Paceibacterota bacterium]